MRSTLRAAACAVLLIGAAPPPEKLPRVLFLTESRGYVHAVVKRQDPNVLSISEQALTDASKERFDVVCAQDGRRLTNDTLSKYRAVVFFTTQDVSVDADALVAWVKSGGAFVGIHSATDTLYDHKGYGEMIGAYFDGHPWHEKVTVRVEDPKHPSTRHLGGSFEIVDEIYQFRAWDRSRVHVLLSLDPEKLDLDRKGIKRKDKDFAVSWAREFGRGRVFYTSLGHRKEIWKDRRFLTHLMEGLAWTMRVSRD